ncbi:unnamed protein product [Protopolystoma xenopodis]|uniref:Uncharacterized protein n=1 Tax=Protopolystoma xenopodis TaxID=117903 RepID=A0A3S5B897_9PLAT|nr:unnamed protein product [Protopolystoma xenopodis]
MIERCEGLASLFEQPPTAFPPPQTGQLGGWCPLAGAFRQSEEAVSGAPSDWSFRPGFCLVFVCPLLGQSTRASVSPAPSFRRMRRRVVEAQDCRRLIGSWPRTRVTGQKFAPAYQ